MEKLKLDLPVLLPEIPDLKDQCVTRLTGTLEGREGIFRVHIKSEKSPAQLCIHFDPDVITLHRIKSIAKQTGAQLHDTFGHLLVEVDGNRHARHARSITRALNEIEGVVDAFAGSTGWIRIEFDKSKTTRKDLMIALKEMGLSVNPASYIHQDEDVKTLIKEDLKSLDRSQKMNSDGRKQYTKNEKKQEEYPHESENHDYEHEHTHKDEESHDHEHEHGGIFGEKTELIFSLICGGLLGTGFSGSGLRERFCFSYSALDIRWSTMPWAGRATPSRGWRIWHRKPLSAKRMETPKKCLLRSCRLGM